MKTPESSRLFTPWQNPANGVESCILTERPASVQMNFYFNSPSMTHDGRYLWTRCKFVPPGGRNAEPVLGVVDFERDEMRICHETQFSASSPMVDLTSGDVYWTSGLDLWKRGPRAEDAARRVNRFPRDLAKGRPPERMASHLFFSADRRSVCIDTRLDDQCCVGDLPLDGSPVRIWQKLDGFYDHAQFSPSDSDLILFAQFWKDHAADPFDGLRPYHRMWLIRRGEKAEPLLRPISHSGHEWWDAAGQHVWYVHYGVGIKKVNLKTRQEENLWPGRLSHAHADRTGQYLVADTMADPVVSDCHVIFKNLRTGKEVEIVNRPPLAAHLTQCGHLHPHPQFCQNDRYICYTTIVHDRVDVALARTDQLIERTS